MCLGSLQSIWPSCILYYKSVCTVTRWMSPSSRSLFSLYVPVLVQSAWWWPIYEVETSSQTINRPHAVCCVWLEVSIRNVHVTATAMFRTKVIVQSVRALVRRATLFFRQLCAVCWRCLLVQTGSYHWYFLINREDVCLSHVLYCGVSTAPSRVLSVLRCVHSTQQGIVSCELRCVHSTQQGIVCIAVCPQHPAGYCVLWITQNQL